MGFKDHFKALFTNPEPHRLVLLLCAICALGWGAGFCIGRWYGHGECESQVETSLQLLDHMTTLLKTVLRKVYAYSI